MSTRPPARTAPAWLAWSLGAALLPAAALADYRDDIGFSTLQEALGASAPDGNGVPVAHIEAPVTVEGQDTWMPNPGDAEFSGKTLTNVSGAPAGVYSGHATSVGRQFYGLTSSPAAAIGTIFVYGASDWLGNGVLSTPSIGTSGQPRAVAARIGNHSWVGSTGTMDGEVLRRMDWLIARDEFIQVIGLTNSGSNPPLFSSADNVIAVGRSDGLHGQGTVVVDALYTAGRTRPDIVVPAPNTSQAAGRLSALAALLVQTAQDNPALSGDPVSSSVTTRAGLTVRNAGRSEVIKAVLMAGARRQTANTSGADISDWRQLASHRSSNGLDTRYGAGQADIARSHAILGGGEHNSLEDAPAGGGSVAAAGFDYDPHFGGASGSNATGTYFLPVQATPAMLSAALVWHLQVNGGTSRKFDGTATRHDLDLMLYDATDDAHWTLVSGSASTGESSEHLYVELAAGRRYALRVVPGAAQPAIDWDHALAWLLDVQPAPDTDGDGTLDETDNCPSVANPGQEDGDGDGIGDACDNCTQVPNADQRDSDSDGYGNLCDADLNNDGMVNFADLSLFRSRFATTDADADFNGDGIVNYGDLAILRYTFGAPPGPSALAP